jgi:thioredoxin reductase (NADPH)
VDRALDREDCCRELGLDLKNVNLPVVELPDGTRLFGPTLRDVADRLGFLTKPNRRQYDVSIYRTASGTPA